MMRTILGAVLLMALALTALSHTPGASQNQRSSGAIAADLEVSADHQSRIESSAGEQVFVYEGRAEAWMRESQLRADRIIVYERSQRAVAEGHARFERGDERMSGRGVEWSYGEGGNRVTIEF